MHKKYLFLLLLLLISRIIFAVDYHSFGTGIKYLQTISAVPNSTDNDDYVTSFTIHNTLDYYFYNEYFIVHPFLGFPQIYSHVSPSTALKTNESIYSEEYNTYYLSSFAGFTLAPSITIEELNPFILNLSLGPSFFVHSYQLFFFSDEFISINSANDGYYKPLNTLNYALGFEGSALATFFLDERLGLTLGLQGGFYWILNDLKFPENTTIDIQESASLDDRNANMYSLNVGITIK